MAGSDRQLLFGGRPSIAILSGAPALLDPVNLTVPPFADLSVSLYLPGALQVTTIHNIAQQTCYVSYTGDYSAAPSLPVQRNIATWPFLAEADVTGAQSGLAAVSSLVVLEDSLTDGDTSTANANRRWPDALARRLQLELGLAGNIGIVNRGTSGNSLPTDADGPQSRRRATWHY